MDASCWDCVHPIKRTLNVGMCPVDIWTGAKRPQTRSPGPPPGTGIPPPGPELPPPHKGGGPPPPPTPRPPGRAGPPFEAISIRRSDGIACPRIRVTEPRSSEVLRDISNAHPMKGKVYAIATVRVLVVFLILWTFAGCAMTGAQVSAKSVIQAKFAAVNRHSLEDIVALYAADAELTAPDFCSPRHGQDDVRRTYQALFSAYPDISVEVQEYVQESDRVAVRFIVRSGLPDRSFEVPIMNFFSVRGGVIVSDEGLFDTRGRQCSP